MFSYHPCSGHFIHCLHVANLPLQLNLLASCHPIPPRTSKTASAKFCRWPRDEHPCVHRTVPNSVLRSPLAAPAQAPLLLLSPTAHTTRQTVSRRARCTGIKNLRVGSSQGPSPLGLSFLLAQLRGLSVASGLLLTGS
ncbi:hypothetical protein HDV57DRAFT_293894 [Trichoderma longibrachiatum]